MELKCTPNPQRASLAAFLEAVGFERGEKADSFVAYMESHPYVSFTELEACAEMFLAIHRCEQEESGLPLTFENLGFTPDASETLRATARRNDQEHNVLDIAQSSFGAIPHLVCPFPSEGPVNKWFSLRILPANGSAKETQIYKFPERNTRRSRGTPPFLRDEDKAEETVILYHATGWTSAANIVVSGIRFDAAEITHSDFSNTKSFYLTACWDIAVDRCSQKLKDGKIQRSAILVYRIPKRVFAAYEHKIYDNHTRNTWRYHVQTCRNSGHLSLDRLEWRSGIFTTMDIVEGMIADRNHEIRRIHGKSHQVCIRNELLAHDLGQFLAGVYVAE